MADTRACTLSAGPASLTLARGASTLTCRHTGLRLQKDAGPASRVVRPPMPAYRRQRPGGNPPPLPTIRWELSPLRLGLGIVARVTPRVARPRAPPRCRGRARARRPRRARSRARSCRRPDDQQPASHKDAREALLKLAVPRNRACRTVLTVHAPAGHGTAVAPSSVVSMYSRNATTRSCSSIDAHSTSSSSEFSSPNRAQD